MLAILFRFKCVKYIIVCDSISGGLILSAFWPQSHFTNRISFIIKIKFEFYFTVTKFLTTHSLLYSIRVLSTSISLKM